jgi:hypothetical protein
MIEKMLKQELKLTKLYLDHRRKTEAALRKAKDQCPPRLKALIEELLRNSLPSTSKPERPSGENANLYAGPDANGRQPRRLKATSRKSPKRSKKPSTGKSPPW